MGQLTEIQTKAARKAAMGIEFNEIADRLDIDRTTLYRWRKHPLFGAEVTRLIDTAKSETENRVVHDVAEINDIVLTTLLDVA